MEQPQTFASIEQAALCIARDSKPSLDYDIKPYGDGYKAENQEQEFDVEFGQQSITFSSKKESANIWWSRFSLSAVGYGNKLRSVPGAICEALDNRMSYKRGNLTEWYINMPIGMEQGFTLESCPGNPNGKHLTIEMAWSGTLTPIIADNGSSLSLTSESGTKILRFGHLMTADATGRLLPSHFEQKRLKNGTSIVRIVVDDADAVYPITIDPLATQEVRLGASDPAANDYFGNAVSIFGDTAVVGAYGKATNTGAAYVFIRGSNGWFLQQKLTADDAVAGDKFGYAVDIDADTIVIGAYGKATSTGAAYVFTRTSSVWKQREKLTASDKATSDQFGISVSFYADTLVVGANGDDVNKGAAYVFTRTGTAWTEQQKLTAGADAVSGDKFGSAVDLDDDTIVVGAPNKTTNTGKVYVFFRTGTTWSEQQKWGASDAATNNYFGSAVSLYANTTVVGAYGNLTNRGAAYVFRRKDSSWTEEKKLTASDAVSGDKFGYAVAVQGNAALVGAPYNSSSKGQVYLFVWDKIYWKEKVKFAANDSMNNDNFGMSIKIDGNTASIGAPARTTNAGVAFGFSISPDVPTNTSKDVIDKEGVNLRTGEVWQNAPDISVNTPVGALALNRVYRQNKHNTYQFMGLGWTHEHYSKLTKTVGTPNTIDVQIPNGGELHFTETLTTDHYVADVGSDAVVDLAGWYNSNWAYRKKVVFDNANQAEDLTDFPVLIKLDSSRINYSQTKNAGEDLRFTSSDGTTLLAHEIEKWDEAGTSYVWVKVPQIKVETYQPHIYMYYGNASAPNGEQIISVWDSNFKGVWHLDETTGTTNNDSTSNANNGTKTSATDPNPVTGQIDGAQDFNVTGNDAITVTDNAGLRPTNVTVEAWVKSNTSTWNEYGWIVSQRTNTVGHGFVLHPEKDNKYVTAYVGISGAWKQTWTYQLYDITVWHHFAMTYNGSNLKVYVDGVEHSTLSTTGNITYTGTTTKVTIGRDDPDDTNYANRWGNGQLDEVRISSVGRSAAWIKATYKSQTDTLASYGTEESFVSSAGIYVLTFGDKSTIAYDLNGVLQRRSWPNNETWTYTYTSGKLTQVNDGHGRYLQFTYISNPGQFNDGQLWQVGDHAAILGGTPSGRYVQFSYMTQKKDGSDYFARSAVKDDFNRADSSSLGANWGSYHGYANLDISSNECRNPATDGTNTYAANYYNVAQYGPDCEAYLTITNRPTNKFLIALRAGGTLSTPNNYGLECNYGGSGTLRIVRTDNGTATTLGATFTQNLAIGDSVGISAIGSTISAYYKSSSGIWTLLATRTDATYNSSGYLAVEAETGGWRADNFGGGTPKALLSTVRDVLGNTWTYDYYGQHADETITNELDFLTAVISPSVDINGDSTLDGTITLRKMRYWLQGSAVAGIQIQHGIQGSGSSLYTTDYAFGGGQ